MKKLNEKNGIKILISLIPYIFLYLFTKIFLNDLYLFEWSARHFYLYIWIIGIILSLIKKYNYSILLSISNIVGIIIGQIYEIILEI